VVKRVVVQNVAPSGTAVLNAADPFVVKMASACLVRSLFASDCHHPVMHASRQGSARVYLDGKDIVAAEGNMEQRIALQDIPLTRNGTSVSRMKTRWRNRRCVGAGIDWKIIRAGVATFINDAATAPGRFNVYDYRGATLIADYGHNPDAILALVSAIDNMPAKRRIVVISGAGDRRDVDISQQTEILGNAFDEVILYQDQCQRGARTAKCWLAAKGLAKATRATAVEEIRGEFPAIDLALSRLQAGDLC